MMIRLYNYLCDCLNKLINQMFDRIQLCNKVNQVMRKSYCLIAIL